VSTAPGRNPPRRDGVIGHRSSSSNHVIRQGFPTSDAVSTFLELATLVALDDLVAIGDALVLDPHQLDPHDIRPWATRDALLTAVADSRGPGCRLARRAMGLVREGAESRPETLLRLLLVRSGLPEPELNPDIHDARGRFIGRADLVYRAARVIVEYDGDQHRTSRAQYEKDIVRLERFRDSGWPVIQVRDHGLFRTPGRTIARVRAALEGAR
jgi:hypothetical protein